VPKNKHSVVAALLMLLVVVPGWYLYGWCLSLLWAWYVVPAFGLAPLGILQAVGLSCILGLTAIRVPAVKTQAQKDAESAETTWEAFGRMLALTLSPLFILAIGWVIGMLGGF
jgi:hypothetical protein